MKKNGDRPSESYWHLDRRIPVALIVTIVLQTMAIVWWAASMNERLSSLEDRVNGMHDFGPRIIRLEEKQDGIRQRLDRIDRNLRRVDAKLERLLYPSRKLQDRIPVEPPR